MLFRSLATVLTPNVPEAEMLLGRRLADTAELKRAVADLRSRGPGAIVLKGGHFENISATVRDYYADTRGSLEFTHRRLAYDARGTGCTLASAIAAGLARKFTLRRAVIDAEKYLQTCYRHALPIGRAKSRALAHFG